MKPWKYILAVKVLEPLTKPSNLSPALPHPDVKTSRNRTIQAVGQRVDTNAHRFVLRLGEWGKSSPTQEASDDHHIFSFMGGGL